MVHFSGRGDVRNTFAFYDFSLNNLLGSQPIERLCGVKWEANSSPLIHMKRCVRGLLHSFDSRRHRSMLFCKVHEHRIVGLW